MICIIVFNYVDLNHFDEEMFVIADSARGAEDEGARGTREGGGQSAHGALL